MFTILILNLIIAAIGFFATANIIKPTARRVITWIAILIVLSVIEFFVLSKLIVDSYSGVKYIN